LPKQSNQTAFYQINFIPYAFFISSATLRALSLMSRIVQQGICVPGLPAGMQGEQGRQAKSEYIFHGLHI
jgi:hypothetical protein